MDRRHIGLYVRRCARSFGRSGTGEPCLIMEFNAVNKDGEPKNGYGSTSSAVKASAARRANSNIMRGSATVFCSLCLFWRRILLRQTARWCTARWNLCGSFLRANFGEVAVEQGNSILLRLFDEQKRLNATNPYAFRDVIRQSCEQIAMNLDYVSVCSC